MQKRSDAVQTENLEGLLQRIREEGTERANQEADQILAVARQQATNIVKEAGAEAKRILQEAESRVAQLTEAGRKALEQAARDMVLTVRSELVGMLDRRIDRAGRDALTGEALQALILKTSADCLAGDGGKHIEIHLNESDLARLADGFVSRLPKRSFRPASNSKHIRESRPSFAWAGGAEPCSVTLGAFPRRDP